MFQHILVPLDSSSRAEQALPVAAKLARASGGSLVLLQAVSPPIDYGGAISQAPYVTERFIKAELAEANSYLALVAKSAPLAGITIKTEVTYGAPAQHILAVAEAQQVDLIVLCSHGRTGFKRWALGSVAHKIVHHSRVPVFVFHEGQTEPLLSRAEAARPLCALVPLDGSPLAETSLLPAAHLVTALAAPAQGTLHLVQVVKLIAPIAQIGVARKHIEKELTHAETYLSAVKEHLQEQLRDLKLSLTWSMALDTDVADALIGTAEHEAEGKEPEGFAGCDLIAITTHGRGGLERWVMGSVTERVLNTTKLPMLIVRPQRGEQA